MAQSTPIVLAAGGVIFAHHLIKGSARGPEFDVSESLILITATTLAALASGGLDVAVPGLGTGAAVLMLLTATLTYGPSLLSGILPDGPRTAAAAAGK